MEKELPLLGATPELELSEVQRFWLTHYQACQMANQSLAAYAREHGLAVKSFYYWKRRLRQLKAIESESQRQSPQPTFHAVKVRRAQGGEAACRLHFPNGMTCELMAIDEPELERLLVTVSQLPR
jgi:hypothetical protein